MPRSELETRNWLATACLGLACVLPTLLIAAVPAKAQEQANCNQEDDAKAHYGNAITLKLVDHLSVPRLRLDIPTGLPVSIAGVGAQARKRSPLSACAHEPLLAEFADFSFPTNHEGSATLFEGFAISSLTLRFADVSPKVQYSSMEKIARGRNDEEVQLANGFIQTSSGKDGVGSYIFQDEDKYPVPVYIGCNPSFRSTECLVRHQTEDGLNLVYRFDYDAVDPADWINLDRVVRNAVEGMVKSERPRGTGL